MLKNNQIVFRLAAIIKIVKIKNKNSYEVDIPNKSFINRKSFCQPTGTKTDKTTKNAGIGAPTKHTYATRTAKGI